MPGSTGNKSGAASEASGAAQSGAAAQGGQATYSKEQLDRLVAEAVAAEKVKYADYDTYKDKAAKYDAAEEAGKSELQKATDRAAALQAEVDKMKAAAAVSSIRAKVAAEMHVPESLLMGSTEEECRKHAKAIQDFAGKTDYPAVKDNGETGGSGGATSPRDAFASWFNL